MWKHIQTLRHWKAASVEGFQSQVLSCSWRKLVLSERPGIKGCKYWVSPEND